MLAWSQGRDTAVNETTAGSAVKRLLLRQVVHAWSSKDWSNASVLSAMIGPTALCPWVAGRPVPPGAERTSGGGAPVAILFLHNKHGEELRSAQACAVEVSP